MDAIIGIRIKIPPEAVVPLLIGLVALLILMFAGAKLADWKTSSPQSAARFGFGAAALFTAVAVYFLVRVLTNQSDPNNEGTGQINFTDAPVAGFMASLAAIFWRYANLRALSAAVGFGLGALMMAKPFVWPVIRVYEQGGSRARDLIDPEHIMFLGPGLVVVIATLVCVLKKPR